MIKERRDVSEALKASLEEKAPGAVLELLRSRGEPYLRVKPDSLLDVCRHLEAVVPKRDVEFRRRADSAASLLYLLSRFFYDLVFLRQGCWYVGRRQSVDLFC